MTEPKIAIRGLTKAFESHVVLSDLDLDVAKGESLVVIGGSGTGKSVLLKCIIGLLSPDSGSIRIDGTEVTHLSEHARRTVHRRIGMLFQAAALFDSMTVWENVAFTLLRDGRSRRQARQDSLEHLAEVGLDEEAADLPVADLSGGMRKRVGLARAIAARPEILFFDEPTTGLDPIMGDMIDRLIVKCTRELGATAITITHDMASARRVGDRVALLYGGKVLWSGPPEKLDDSGNPYVEQFVTGATEGPIPVNP